MIYVFAEDRISHEPALYIAICSLIRFDRTAKIRIYGAGLSSEFLRTIEAINNVELRSINCSTLSGWSVKARVLIQSLEESPDSVVWLDSDIVLNGSISSLMSKFDERALVISEEALAGQIRFDDNSYRARSWNFHVARNLPFVANTCVMRVNHTHLLLLRAWENCMSTDLYQEAQRMAFQERPPHLGGDQDVITALLSSKEFANIDVMYLIRGKHIIQYYGPYGFNLRERIRAMFFGMPAIIHSQAFKPWVEKSFVKGSANDRYLFKILMDTSPYNIIARSYINEDTMSHEWLSSRTILGRILVIAGLNYPPFTGLPVAIISDTVFILKLTRRKIIHLLSKFK